MDKIVQLKDIDNNNLYSNDIVLTQENNNQICTKYANGRLEILFKKEYEHYSINDPWGDGFESTDGRDDLGTWKIPFKETPTISYAVTTPDGAPGGVEVEDIKGCSNTNIGKVIFFRPAFHIDLAFTLHIIAIGKWK